MTKKDTFYGFMQCYGISPCYGFVLCYGVKLFDVMFTSVLVLTRVMLHVNSCYGDSPLFSAILGDKIALIKDIKN